MPKPLIIQFTPIRSCLVNLPSKWVNALLDQNKASVMMFIPRKTLLNFFLQLPQNVILEIVGGAPSKKIYCGWSGEASKPLSPNSVFTHGAHGKLDVLEIDPQLGLAVGLQDGQKVNVEFCRNVTECTTVSVEPLTEDDWEILELHAGYVEENLLSQIRVVYTNQIMCVWIHGKTLVRLVVAALDPKQPYLKLSNVSEVIVAPKVRKNAVQEEKTTDLNATTTTVKKVMPAVGLRVSPQVDVQDLEVRVHPDTIQSLIVDGKVPERIRLTKLVPAFLSNTAIKKEEEGGVAELEESLIAKAVFATLVVTPSVPLKHVAIGSVLKDTLELKDFDIVK